MVSCRLALLVLVCAVVAAQSQRRQLTSSRRTISGPGTTSITSRASSRGRSGFNRASTSQTSSRRSGPGFSRTTSQLSARAGGSLSGRGSTSRASSAKASSGFRRTGSRTASQPVSTFGRTRTSSSSTGSRTSVGSSFSRQRVSTSTAGRRFSSGSAQRKPQTVPSRQSSFQTTTRNDGRKPSRSSGFNRGSSASSRGSSAFNRRTSTPSRSSFGSSRAASTLSRGSSGSGRGTSAFSRSPSTSSRGSRTRAQTRPQSAGGRNRVLGGAQKNSLLKQSPKVNFDCPESDGFFADRAQCDKYYSCEDGVAKEHVCPDGLLFHPNRTYPCVYPVEANCEGRAVQQRAKATAECPRQFGRYPLPGAGCQRYKVCVKGEAWEMTCPGNLMWNQANHMCDYPDVVSKKCADAYLGFQCPQREFTAAEVGEFTREPHPSNCTKFYVCVNKEDGTVQPRLQGCPPPSVFDPSKAECNNDPQEVPGCEDAIPAPVLAAFRQRSSEEEERRANRLAELKKRLQG